MGLVSKFFVLLSRYRSLLPYITAQAKLETGGFTSGVYSTDNNMFGMKWTQGRRGQVATKGLISPEGNYYAHYSSDVASLRDLLLWMDYAGFPVSVANSDQYAIELKNRGYFTAGLSLYQSNLKVWLNKS